MQFKRQSREEISVNLTPLIDVVFLLLIFFMVSTTFTKEARLTLNLPSAETGQHEKKAPKIVDVMINEQGNYVVNGMSLVNNQADTLRRAIKRISKDDSTIPFVIAADALTPHQSVVTAMDVAGQLGFINLSITTQKEKDQ
jgi:biopolymer transport protein ExbD